MSYPFTVNERKFRVQLIYKDITAPPPSPLNLCLLIWVGSTLKDSQLLIRGVWAWFNKIGTGSLSE